MFFYLYLVSYNRINPTFQESLGASKAVTLKQIAALYQEVWRESRMTVMVSSDLNQNELLSKLGFLAKMYTTQPKPWTFNVSKPNTAETQPIYFFETASKEKAHIYMGRIDEPYQYSDHYLLKNLSHHPLGGAFNSRLNMNLREDKGYTYGVHSGYMADDIRGTYEIHTEVAMKDAVPALQELLGELNAYTQQPMKAQELSDLKATYFESKAMAPQHAYDQLNRLSFEYDYQITADKKQHRLELVQALQSDVLQQIAKQEIQPDAMIKLVTGSKEVKEKLQQVFPHVVEVDTTWSARSKVN